MKKFLCCFLAGSLLAAITACGNTRVDTPLESAETTGQEEGIAVTEAEENSLAEVGVFNFETKTVLLNSGYEMPVYGIGTYSLREEVCVESVSFALESGIRLIDTAYMHHNDVICCDV